MKPLSTIARSRELVRLARAAGLKFRWHDYRLDFRGAPSAEAAAFILKNEPEFAPAIVLELVESVFGPCRIHDAPSIGSGIQWQRHGPCGDLASVTRI